MEQKKRKTILIIEDEEGLVESLSRLFWSHGYAAAGAYDAITAVSKIRKESVDLVILDLAIPAGGGFFVLENIRGASATANLPVVVLTARTEKALEERAKAIGVEGYVKKPFDPEELVKIVKENIG